MNVKKFAATAALTSVLSGLVPIQAALAADSPQKGKVVINEIAWMGSADSSTDEWIELYNDSSTAVDISGWKITDDGATDYVVSSGSIPAKGYFLIEDHEDAVKGLAADAVINMSLANGGDSLVLKDANGDLVDTVNGSGGAWYAGNSTSKATMERKAVSASDVAANWQDSTAGNGNQASGGSAILGTPKGANSGQTTGVALNFETANTTVSNGDIVNIKLKNGQVADLFSYGFDLSYDPAVLEYQNATKGSFLNFFGNDATSFQSGLLDNQVGTAVVAEARTLNTKTGISGQGDLFTVSFKVIGQNGASSDVQAVATKSFLGKISGGDMAYTLAPLTLTVGGSTGGTVQPVTGLSVSEGVNRYELKLSWTAPSGGADSYKVFRKGVDGTYLELGNVSTTEFIDKDGVNKAGNIIANLNYDYRVIAVKGGNDSAEVDASGKETRGLKGDINRDDRVDGRDLNGLALAFGTDITMQTYNPRADLNYDGDVNGSDLIDLGVDWAKTYTP